MSFRACRMHHTDEGMAPHGMPSASMGAASALKVWSPLAKTARGHTNPNRLPNRCRLLLADESGAVEPKVV